MKGGLGVGTQRYRTIRWRDDRVVVEFQIESVLKKVGFLNQTTQYRRRRPRGGSRISGRTCTKACTFQVLAESQYKILHGNQVPR